MKNSRGCFLKKLLLSAIVVAGLAVSVPSAQAQVSRLAGNWDVTKINEPTEKRSLSFWLSGGQINGSYLEAGGTVKAITEIRFLRGLYRFTIADLGILFVDLRRINRNSFEGRLEYLGSKRAAEQVRMIRKQ